MTRVVVDVEDDFLKYNFEAQDEFEWAKVITAAREQIISNGISEYLNEENLDEIVLDDECPYDGM